MVISRRHCFVLHSRHNLPCHAQSVFQRAYVSLREHKSIIFALRFKIIAFLFAVHMMTVATFLPKKGDMRFLLIAKAFKHYPAHTLTLPYILFTCCLQCARAMVNPFQVPTCYIKLSTLSQLYAYMTRTTGRFNHEEWICIKGL